ncbi:MAG TPA: hypothetical protein ENI20_19480 [Bacteroides sp.]|nr:hypothetical protein [Bacteroides sp.]
MKKHLLSLLFALSLVMLIGVQQTLAQKEKTSTITITITEDDEVTTDTTFELAEGQDPEMIKKMVSHMAGGDLHKVHVSQDVHMSHKGHNKMLWISEDGEHNIWSAEKMMADINIDSIKEAHGGGKVMVMKDENGDITVKELDDEHAMHMGDDMHGAHGEMMFIESGEDGEVITIKIMKSGEDLMMIHEDGDVHKQHRVIIHTEDGDCDGKERKIEVIVHVDEDMEWVEKGDGEETVEVYVIKTDDGEEVKVIKKKVKVEIEEDDDEEKEVKEKMKK